MTERAVGAVRVGIPENDERAPVSPARRVAVDRTRIARAGCGNQETVAKPRSFPGPTRSAVSGFGRRAAPQGSFADMPAPLAPSGVGSGPGTRPCGYLSDGDTHIPHFHEPACDRSEEGKQKQLALEISAASDHAPTSHLGSHLRDGAWRRAEIPTFPRALRRSFCAEVRRRTAKVVDRFLAAPALSRDFHCGMRPTQTTIAWGRRSVVEPCRRASAAVIAQLGASGSARNGGRILGS
jgi:hypothetical protein